MARAARLKVFRTAVGFHDAYVAAPSRRAALAAWGSDKDLFARGAAEEVTDEALIAEPLASPGKVVRRLRGTAEEQLAALPPDPPRKTKPPRQPKAAPRRSSPAAKPKPGPRPSRAALDKAERALAEAEERHVAEVEELRRRERALVKDRHRLEADQAERLRVLEAERGRAEEAYRAAMATWEGRT